MADQKPRCARELRNAIRRKVEDQITDLLVKRFEDPPRTIVVTAENGEIVLNY